MSKNRNEIENEAQRISSDHNMNIHTARSIAYSSGKDYESDGRDDEWSDYAKTSDDL